jgi:hypothetical protein
MKITKTQLKQIIKEELGRVLQEQETPEVWASSTKNSEFSELLRATTSKNAEKRVPGMRGGVYTKAAHNKVRVVKAVITAWWEEMPKDYVFKFTFSNGQAGITPRRELIPRNLNRNAQVNFVDTYFGEIGYESHSRMKILDILQIDVIAPGASEPDAEPKFDDLAGLHSKQISLLINGPWGTSINTLAAAFYNADGEIRNLFVSLMQDVLADESASLISQKHDEWYESDGLSDSDVKAARQKLLQGLLETMKENPGAFGSTKWEPGGAPSWAPGGE